MFDNLLETNAKKERSAGGTMLSVVMHVVIIAVAVYVTGKGVAEAVEEAREEKIDFVEIKEEVKVQETPPPPPPDAVMAAAPIAKGFQVLQAPIDIPDVLPDIDLSKKVTNEADFTGKGVAGGSSQGVAGGVPQALTGDATYFEFQVEKQAAAAPGSTGPTYPDMLKQAGIEGEVLASFIVDTTGRADLGSFKVIKSTHEQFTAAVRRALPQMRFLPAEVGGKKVRQLVQQPFGFTITR
jgi:periplasmic protein TonB